MAKKPILVGLSAFIVGSVAGFLIAGVPTAPRSCPLPSSLSAHFLERSPFLSFASSSSGSLHGAAVASATSERSSEETIQREPLVVPITILSSASSTSSETSSSVSSGQALSAQSSVSAVSAASSVSSISSSNPSDFPAFGKAIYPVNRAPNWGAMTTPAQWNRSYAEMDRADFVPIPAYTLSELTTPMSTLQETRNDPETIRILTAKLFYSTRFFGSYDLDQGEFTGDHAGIDLKLPEGTPVGAIAGGRVHAVIAQSDGLGLHVVIEHRLGNETFYSIYGHLKSVGVATGDDVEPGNIIGRSGSTGRSSGPHLHLQIDRGEPNEVLHTTYWPGSTPSRSEAALHTVNPITFIQTY